MPPLPASPILRKVLSTAILACWLGPAAARAQNADLSLRLTIEAAADDAGARVTVNFSRPADYRFEESRGRLRLIMAEPIVSVDPAEDGFESSVLRRYKSDIRPPDSEIVFYLGREFETFTSEELSNPFRVVLQFLKVGVPPSSAPAAPGRDAGDAAAEPEPDAVPSPPEGTVIMIDPGHGGGEEGARGAGGLKEKDLVLDIALKLRGRLREAGFSPMLTRQDDRAVDLASRTAEANHSRAGLLVSIHANASPRSMARGAETYFLSAGTAGESETAALARTENLGGSDFEPGTGGSDDAEIRMVLWEMAQVGHLSASSQLAEMIQTEMNTLGDTRDRGVKQAPFRVLVGAAMPAVLVEVGFLSNPEEEKLLATDAYREQIATALAAAIGRFAGPGGAGATR